MRAVVVIMVVLTAAGVAAAQPEPPAPSQPSSSAPPPPSLPAGQPQSAAQPLNSPAQLPARDAELSENGALWLSLGSTVAVWTFASVSAQPHSHDVATMVSHITRVSLFGMLVAPSLGHWYARSPYTHGLFIRLVGGLIGYAASARPQCIDACPKYEPGVMYVALALELIGSVTDILTARGDARRYNEQHQLSIAPIIRSDRSDNRTLGLALVGEF